MRHLFSLLLSYLLATPALAIYDLAAINITPNANGITSFCFQLDTSQPEMYLAVTTNYQDFLFFSPELTLSPWQPPTPPAEQGMEVYLIKPLYRYQPLEESLEIGVKGQEACQYQLCVSETECSNLTVTENHGQRLAEVVYNESPAILTLCPDDHANWTVCSVLPQPEGIWGRDETLSVGDVITPTVLHLQDDELTPQSSQSLTVGETVPVVKSVCDMQAAVITASYFGSNHKQQFERLYDKEDDVDESCRATDFQFKAGVRIVVD